MPWQPTRTRRIGRVAGCLAILVLGALGDGFAAVNVETAVMPGQVIEGHEKLEADCENCHVRFDREAQPRLCLACHKAVASDVRDKRRYHGRIKERECRVCHTDHKGRNARTIVLDERKFDHAFTDLRLRGKHAVLECASCHLPGIKRRNTPSDCSGCHRKDDKHNGELGPKCESCHQESDWKEARADHDRTRFPLRARHSQIKCEACHTARRYTDTPRDCASCHRKDDAHKGQLGPQCGKCHEETRWKASVFDHDRDARFPLRGRHREAKCESCHKSPGLRDKPPVRCASCHEQDDKRKGHTGRFGANCESCHGAGAWKPALFNHDRDTRFPLRGQHATAKCEACHRAPLYQEKPAARCAACHERSDKHSGQLDRECQVCHNERSWRETSFEHSRSRFPLLGRHKQLACSQCHATLAYKDAKTDCASCHAKDDRHKGIFHPRCEQCHDAQDWKRIDFDHDGRTRFKLEGRHLKLACYTCHKSALKEPKGEAAPGCGSCHKEEDVHFDTYGAQCQRCHVAEDWRRIVKRDPLAPALPRPKPSRAPR